MHGGERLAATEPSSARVLLATLVFGYLGTGASMSFQTDFPGSERAADVQALVDRVMAVIAVQNALVDGLQDLQRPPPGADDQG